MQFLWMYNLQVHQFFLLWLKMWLILLKSNSDIKAIIWILPVLSASTWQVVTVWRQSSEIFHTLMDSCFIAILNRGLNTKISILSKYTFLEKWVFKITCKGFSCSSWLSICMAYTKVPGAILSNACTHTRAHTHAYKIKLISGTITALWSSWLQTLPGSHPSCVSRETLSDLLGRATKRLGGKIQHK